MKHDSLGLLLGRLWVLAFLSPDDDATVLSANDLWKDLTCLDVGNKRSDWKNVLPPESFAGVNDLWKSLLIEKKTV